MSTSMASSASGSSSSEAVSFSLSMSSTSTAWVAGSSSSVTAPRGCVADKHSSLVSGDLGNCGKVPQVLGTSRSDCVLRLSFHNSEIEIEVREDLELDRN